MTSKDPILDIPEESIGPGRDHVPCGGAPPHLPVSLDQILATQNDLMRRLVENVSVVGPCAINPDIKREIIRTQTFRQLTYQSLLM
jgi:hypothetical protein